MRLTARWTGRTYHIDSDISQERLDEIAEQYDRMTSKRTPLAKIRTVLGPRFFGWYGYRNGRKTKEVEMAEAKRFYEERLAKFGGDADAMMADNDATIARIKAMTGGR